MKNKSKIIIVILCAAAFIAAGAFFGILELNNPPSDFYESVVTFKVSRGSAAKTIISDLKAKNLIRSELYAYAYVRLKKLNLRAGTYQINSEMTTQDILHKLTQGSQALKKLTIPEGLTLKKTAQIFDNAGLIKAEEFINIISDPEFLAQNGIKADTAEGFLYPDTYFFGEEDTPEMMIKMIIKTFFEKTVSIPNFPKEFSDIHKKVILASIIEREYQLPEEAPIISSVFTNRLKINMGLQSCATVEYIITEIKNKKHPKRLFFEDLEIQNPYNTYIHAGLPPGPISNPGFTALNAACNPANTDYFYFRLIDPDTGKHIFNKTVQEHNRAGNTLLLKKAAGQ
ncbi:MULTISPECIES: endolytic transglycosylase MltG [unclassified Treponema]|uniref:endolytic transglycosylase MltG n=1 Tax=unclassified Treponema TaxID=2638727 RepID=UPI0020A24BE8|nr:MULTISPECIES: endolytic transglycosylase MltG [unclassified Treponema]UTC68089.1 endolytic transglycosylase MltG [Treponema sp. OMZ 789]UTC70811.1 endolytic transglycosylase MltG [Treponema sp. OMZ 790]UTC73551.1 endolytic transglycosylase MltG [Treponema sp. OMZ 791]